MSLITLLQNRTLKTALLTFYGLLSLTFSAAASSAETTLPLVKKQVFSLPSLTLFNGATITNVNVGWEAYGTLNEDKSNVVLITHYFSGSSHAAGRYTPEGPVGYWDALIGPGKAIDTSVYYVISVDTLVNLNAYSDTVTTTGPATVNPDTGKPWGLDFPVVTIRDFVNVQKSLLESLGISKLHAVVGASMGSMQAIDWASAYPEWVPRMISVIGTGETDAWTTAALEQWATPIKVDSRWNNGDYSIDEQPMNGLVGSLMLITQHALTPEFFNQQGKTLGYQQLEDAPMHDIRQNHSIVNWLRSRAESRAQQMDANHLLYLVRACQLFVAGHKGSLEQGLSSVKAKTLFVPASTDLLLMPYLAQNAHDILNQNGVSSQYQALDGELGHLEGVLDISEQANLISEFLSQ